MAGLGDIGGRILTYSTMALVGLLVSFALICLSNAIAYHAVFRILVPLTVTIARTVPEINERL